MGGSRSQPPIAVVDARVCEVEPSGRYGKLRILPPMDSELGFNYLIFSDNNVERIVDGIWDSPPILSIGRMVRCLVYEPNQNPGRHRAMSIYVVKEGEDFPQED
jgi:hypothetical protein